MKRILQSVFLGCVSLLCILEQTGKAKDWPIACLQSEATLKELTESSIPELVTLVKDVGADGLAVSIPDLSPEGLSDVEKILAALDKTIPPDWLVLRLSAKQETTSRASELGNSLSQWGQHPCILKLGPLPLILVTWPETGQSPSWGNLASKGVLGWFPAQPLPRPQDCFSVLRYDLKDQGTLEEDAGALRQTHQTVGLYADIEKKGIDKLSQALSDIRPDCLIVRTGPALLRVSPEIRLALGPCLEAFKSNTIQPCMDLRYIFTEQQGESLLQVTILNRNPQTPLEVKVQASALPPLRILPQEALCEVKESNQLIFRLSSPNPLAPGNYPVRIAAEAQGYKTALRVSHKVPLISPAFFVVPSVDGDLTDWGTPKTAPLLNEKGEPAGKIMSGWTGKFLILGLFIENAKPGEKASKGGDCIRIGLDPLWDQKDEGMEMDDVVLILSLDKHGSQVSIQGPQSLSSPIAQTQLAVGVSEKGTTYELAVYPSPSGIWRLQEQAIMGLSVLAKVTQRESGKSMTLGWGQGLVSPESPALFGILGLGATR